ncbi:hypothetical protein Dde_0564 [Oleidesulfovibrio alaskensis G20]|jgi:hypothetical protein|uniref:Uncharacterized protein n=1 Tax=Oleidesulfovibrio alaskensis (strain ATCC BAA-1058 / DSM 17464 / G20) TaxID=207559 RepID=Q315N1_OLEA2|nr:hypothetical protein [Oleidesulfovibrio alaskensis]ABB37365.1 hypothetical protein Dde_0564 [Oleidesulfovibrio alaskensis G20]MBG0773266.1 hypothetical protein [Oleidesulfovibrio alaskensis]MBL3583136.1 hypothetical protein [Oleidesulfovibrio alaskensis]
MIIIDGQESSFKVNNFANLEELLVKVMEQDYLENRVVTDVLINDESFSEIYPHQAEDIETREIASVEIRSVPVAEMAMSISRELYKVVQIMSEGSRKVAELFRQADDSEALETYQDLLEVIRDFLGMIGVLRNEFSLQEQKVFNEAVEEISSLLGEMTEVMENEDWILLADLLEYEFLPAVDKWKQVIHLIREDIKSVKG